MKNNWLNMAEPWDFAILVGAGGIRSSAADMLTFATAAIDPNSPIGPAIKTMLSVRISTRDPQVEQALGWEVVSADAAAGTLLARQTTKVFRFVDDVVVRVRPADGGGALVDVRSKSRDGRGDMGVNAARIRAFAEKLPR